MLIYVSPPFGDPTINLEVEGSDTIWEVKVKYCLKIDPMLRNPNYLPQNATLIFAGKSLDNDNATIADYNIQKENKIHHIVTFRGD